MAKEEPNSGASWFGGRRLRIAGLVGAIFVVLAVVGYWFIVPRVADSMVRSKLASIEKRARIVADFDRVETSALEGVELHGVTVRRKETDQPFFEVDRVRAKLNLYHLLLGNPVVGDIDLGDMVLTVHRFDDGSTNIERVLRNLRGGESGDAEPTQASSEGPPGFLRYFGGEFPHASIANATLHLRSSDDAPPWPISEATVPKLEVVSSGETAKVKGKVAVTRGEGADPRWSIPKQVDFEGTARLPLGNSTGTAAFDPPLELVGLRPLRFARVGLSKLSIAKDHTLGVSGVSLAVQADRAPRSFAAVDNVSVSFESWPQGPTDLSIEKVVVEKPKVVAHVDRQHGSAVNDFNHLARAPVARHVGTRAARIARDMYLDIPEWRRPDLDGDADDEQKAEADSSDEAAQNEEDEGDSPKDEEPGLLERAKALVQRTMTAKIIPNTVEITGAEVHLTDKRRMGLMNPAAKVGLRDGSFIFRHDLEAGSVTLRTTLDAYSGESTSRGSLSAEISGNYQKGTVEGSAKIDALDLNWVSQMVGVRAARRVRGGVLKAEFETARDEDSGRHEFSGFASLENAMFAVDNIAKAPIEDLDTAYTFEGFYDPNAEMPEPEYIEWKHLDPDDVPEEGRPNDKDGSSGAGGPDAGNQPPDLTVETKGALVLTSGKAELNGVSAEFRPAIYGLDGFRHLPTRLDFEVGLQKTEVQTLFDAVPKAIRGPVDGTKMKGSFGWDFSVEIPLHNAGEMEWETKPTLERFELVELPAEVDVRILKDGFTHTIRDKTIDFERTVQIPPMRPVKAKFLVDNCELTLQDLDERRRRRGWPPTPAPSALAPQTPGSVLQSPQVWATDAAEGLAAAKPWEPGASLTNIQTDDIPPGRKPIPYARKKIRESLENDAGTERGTTTVRTESSSKDDNGPGKFLAPFGKNKQTGGGEEKKGQTDQPLDKSIFVKKKGKLRLHPYGIYVYVPLHHMSKWLPRAIMTTEDNSFFGHDGFNWFALEESVEDNVDAGGFVRGGSTVSMQLVKNVFLSFDKVLARKIREAFLVWLMEEVVDVPKARILEMYFNIIEFGPGIFGIHDASVHYFGKRPDELTLSEVLWLVSIVPNPKEYHRYYERGKITDAWFDTITTYAEIMQSRERATAKDVETVKNNRPTFYKPKPGGPQLRPIHKRSKTPTLEDFSKIFQ